MKHIPYWQYQQKKVFAPLDADIACDILIVGGGIGGASLAYFLSKTTKKRIVLVEKGEIGAGATGHSAGMLLIETEGVTLPTLATLTDTESALLYWESQKKVLDMVSQIIEDEKIECDAIKEPLYIFSKDQFGNEQINMDIDIRQKSNLVSKSIIGQSMNKLFHSDVYAKAEQIQGGLSVNPLALVSQLAEKASARGVLIFEQTEIERSDLSQGGSVKSDSSLTVSTVAGQVITYSHIVLAIDAYNPDPDMDKFKTTCVVTEELSDQDLEQIGFADHKMFFETESISFHYAKYLKEKRVLFGFGDRRIQYPDEQYEPFDVHLKNIQAYISTLFPQKEIVLSHAWSGVYGLHKGHFPLCKINGDARKGCIQFGGAGTQVLTMTIANAIAELLAKVEGDREVLDDIIKTLSHHNQFMLSVLTNTTIDKSQK
jgi:glycine/D-amino acid oxidase-like deaminating enzyme